MKIIKIIVLTTISIALSPLTVSATQVINTDTTWTAAQPIELSDDIEVASGVTLTVEAGAIVNGNGFQLLAGGNVALTGTNTLSVVLNNTHLVFGSDPNHPGRIDLQYARMYGGSFLKPTGYGSYGTFSLANSRFSDVDGFYLWYPVGPNSITQNIFERSEGFNILLNSSGSLSITNNVFVEQTTDYAIGVSANYADTLQLSNNSFLSIDRVALQVFPNFTNNPFPAENNYFGTTNIQTINAMILDRNDGLDRSDFIDFQPFLTEAHLNTPDFDYIGDQSPQCGTANGSAFFVAPTFGLCSLGTPSTVEGAGPWFWSCNNLSATTSCSSSQIDINNEDLQESISVLSADPAQHGLILSASVGENSVWRFTPNGTGNGGTTGGFISLQNAIDSGIVTPPPTSMILFDSLLSFTLFSESVGGSTTVRINFGRPIPAGASYWKFGPLEVGGNPVWHQYPALINNSSGIVIVTLTDGIVGDKDLSANGFIQDPGGIFIPTSGNVTPIPVQSKYSAAFLALVLLIVFAQRMRANLK